MSSRLEEAREVISNLVEALVEEGLGTIDAVTEAEWFLDSTQPKLYAVQFRSMHTAIHSIAIFEDRTTAVWLLNVLNNDEEFPEIDLNMELMEINFRNPPTEHDGYKLKYVNNCVNSIPDVYGY